MGMISNEITEINESVIQFHYHFSSGENTSEYSTCSGYSDNGNFEEKNEKIVLNSIFRMKVNKSIK